MNRTELQSQIIAKADEDATFRQQLIHNPREAISSLLGVTIPAGLEISVFEETPQRLCLVLPAKSAPSDELSEADLSNVAGGTGGWRPNGRTGGPVWDDREPV